MIKWTKTTGILIDTNVYTSDLVIDYSNQFEELKQPLFLIVKKNGYYDVMERNDTYYKERKTSTDYTNIDDYTTSMEKDTLQDAKRWVEERRAELIEFYINK